MPLPPDAQPPAEIPPSPPETQPQLATGRQGRGRDREVKGRAVTSHEGRALEASSQAAPSRQPQGRPGFRFGCGAGEGFAAGS